MLLLWLILIILISLSAGCPGLQYIWPQKDISPHEINKPTTLKQKILISSRESDFKTSVVQNIINTFRDKNVSVLIRAGPFLFENNMKTADFLKFSLTLSLLICNVRRSGGSNIFLIY